MIQPVPGEPPLTEEALEQVIATITRHVPERHQLFESSGELDISYQCAGTRYRVNAFRQRGAISAVFRVIPHTIPSFETLHMPPGVRRLADEHRGLVLVTGATGSGKSTTLAAMIDHINQTRKQHIITIEDPIEMLHPDRNCIVNQREVGIDTVSFSQALRRALRQDPDVILIGELRDSETAETALAGGRVGTSRLLDDAHDRRGRDDRPDDRVLPRRQAADDPLDPRRRAPRRRQPAAAAEARLGPDRRRRGDGRQRPDRRADPREPHRGDPDRRSARAPTTTCRP